MSEWSDGYGIIAFSTWDNVIFWKAHHLETGINLTGHGAIIFLVPNFKVLFINL